MTPSLDTALLCNNFEVDIHNILVFSFQLELTWHGSDSESSIHDYSVALSFTYSGEGDIMPYKSTHESSYFITYHPNLLDMQKFYIMIKAVNKAGLETIQVCSKQFREY